MKKNTIAILLAAVLMLCGCSEVPDPAAGVPGPTTPGRVPLENIIVAVPAEVPAEVPDPITIVTVPDPGYVHGEDGYFNLLEEYPEIEMRYQEGGTCWLYSGVCNMETAYAMKNNSYISIDPLELLDITYLNEKEEGFFPDKGVNGKNVGGWQWIITESLTNGFGEYTIESSVILDSSDREALKENLRTRGGISVGVNDTHENLKGRHGDYFTINYGMEEFDHDITIVGYDDYFPKEYFNVPAAEDGAWITYNSSYGDSRLYYVSYCSPLEYAVSHLVTEEYSDVLGYDCGNEEDRFIKTGDSTTTANVFHKAGTLVAVGTYNDFDNQDITIEIYDGSFTNVLYTQQATLDYHGYHTIKLDEPVDVTDYAVAITYSKGAPVEGENIDYGDIDYVTKAEAGQSFVKTYEWHDLTEDGIEEELGIDFKPGNCCIKALYQ
ncbi:MAG: hypothetical protein IKO32_07395 [Lachnospiraceae bacterium]|nr:hypothetical protein [Lachnospiraceae bacterium]